MRKLLLIVGLAALLAPPAWADDADDGYRFHFRLEGMDELKHGLEDMLRSLPMFEAPYVDENGDIIIRRAPPLDLDLDRLFDPPAEEPEFADI